MRAFFEILTYSIGLIAVLLTVAFGAFNVFSVVAVSLPVALISCSVAMIGIFASYHKAFNICVSLMNGSYEQAGEAEDVECAVESNLQTADTLSAVLN